jgi:hypothetical protein
VRLLLASLLAVPWLVVAAPHAVADDAAPAAYHPLAPCRLTDSRTGDNAEWLAPDHLRARATGRCAIPDEATAVVASVIAIAPQADGFAVAFPAGAPQPDTSTLNYRAHQTRTNSTIVGLGEGAFDLVSTGVSDLVVDVTGYFAPAATATAGRFTPLVPARLVDTRDGTGGLLPSGASLDAWRSVEITLPDGVPSDAAAVAVNLTVTETTGAGYLSVWRTGETRPSTSIVNFDGATQTRAITAIVPTAGVGDRASFTVETSIATAFLVDLTGFFTGATAPDATDGLFVMSPRRLLDTRDAEPLYGNGAFEVTMPPAAAAVAVNTVMMSTRPSWLRLSPAGVPAGETSSVNGGEADTATVANMGLVPTSDRGVEVLTFRMAHAVVDLIGYFQGPPMTAVEPPTPNVAPPGYPTGFCDAMNSPGLNSGTAPPDLRQIGTSVRGRPIYAEYWGPAGASKVVIVIGQVHGNECAPALLVQHIRDHPPAGFGIWLIPTLNPDGYAAHSRQNANRVDLNADGLARSQPETQALMNFTRDIKPVLTVHTHSPNGQAGWFGTGTYYATQPGASNAPLSSEIAARLQSVGLEFGGAGIRYGTNWFLWQGQRAVWPGQESLLVEFHAIHQGEVPNATPRPGTLSVGDVSAQAAAVLAALEAVIGGG